MEVLDVKHNDKDVMISLPGSEKGTIDRQMGAETERWLVGLDSHFLLAFEHGTVAVV